MKYTPTQVAIALVILSTSAAVTVLSTHGTAQAYSGTAQAPKHFYVYNECYKPIIAHVLYIPTGQGTTRQDHIIVSPGHQVLVAVEARDLIPVFGLVGILESATSADGVLTWRECGVRSMGPEYTYVISCTCDAGVANCQLPRPWPTQTFRQFPDKPDRQGLGAPQ